MPDNFLQRALKERARRAALSDVNNFIEYVMIDPKTGQHFKQGTIHREMHAHIAANQFSLIIFPRSFGKTSQIIGRVMDDLGRDPSENIKVISASDGVAKKRVKAVRDYITRSKNLHEIYPNLVPDETSDTWSKTALTVKRDVQDPNPSLEAVGVLSTGQGDRATKIYFDDIVSHRNAIKVPKLREAVKDVFEDVWLNLLGPDGKAVYIATLLHKDDLTHQLMENPLRKKLMFAVGPKYESPWGEKWPPKALKARRKLIGQKAFDRNFRNKALSDEDILFKGQVLEDAKLYDLAPHADFFKKLPKYVGVDLGISKQGAYTVLFVIAVDGNVRYPVKIIRGHYSSPQTAKLIETMLYTEKPIAICVENNSYQDALIQWLKAINVKAPIIPYTTGLNKVDPDIGLPSIALELESGMWKIPMGGQKHPERCDCSFCAWLGEMADYPLGKYTDCVMACLFAKEAYRQSSGDGKMQGFEVWHLEETEEEELQRLAHEQKEKEKVNKEQLEKEEEEVEFLDVGKHL